MRSWIVLGALLLAQPALAADSTWLVCKGIAHGGDKFHLVVSALEMRGADGASRDLALTVVRRERASKTVVKNIKVGKPSAFKATAVAGKVTLTTDFGMLVLDGMMDREHFKAVLVCETLDDLAIDHP